MEAPQRELCHLGDFSHVAIETDHKRGGANCGQNVRIVGKSAFGNQVSNDGHITDCASTVRKKSKIALEFHLSKRK